MEINRITGDADAFVQMLRKLEQRVASIETRDTGSIYISGQMITADPATGVETTFGVRSDGSYGIEQWINDTTPPDTPATPTVAGDRAVFEITWNGLTQGGLGQPEDYDRTVVQMATTDTNPVWIEVNYFMAAGKVIIGDQPYGEARYFRLISYDKNGNASTPSITVSATLVPPMESPEMTEWIGGIEQDVIDAETAATNAQASAQTAQEAADEAIASLRNHVAYGDLEVPGMDDVFAGNSSFSLENNSTLAHSGARYAETSVLTASDRGVTLIDIPVIGGRTYRTTFYMWMDADVTGSAGMPMMWVLEDGTEYNNGTYWGAYYRAHRENQVVGSWFKVEADIVTPATATYMRPRFYVWKDAAPEGTIVRFDSFSVLDVTDALAAQATADQAAYDAQLAAEAAGNAQTAADGKSTVWYLPTSPAGTLHKEGDLWFDEANNNEPKVWSESTSSWVSARDATIAVADQKAADAATTANNAVTSATEAQSAAEAAQRHVDILIASSDSLVIGGDFETDQEAYSTYRKTVANTYSGSYVIELPSTEQVSFYFPKISARPGSIMRGSLVARKYPEDVGNVRPFMGLRITHSDGTTSHLYRTAGAGVDQALSTSWAEYVYEFAELPATTVAVEPRVYTSGTTWGTTGMIYIDRVDMIDMSQHKAALQAAEDARLTAVAAAEDAFDAMEAANTAQASADGKTHITYNLNPPSVSGIADGDTYYQMSDMDDGWHVIGMWRWNASTSTWDTHKLDGLTISHIDAGSITAGSLSSARIAAGSITADKLMVGATGNMMTDPLFKATSAWSNSEWIDSGTNGKSGAGSMLVPAGTGQRGSYLGLGDGNHRIKVTPGSHYRLSAWVRTDALASGSSVAIYGRAYSSTGTPSGFSFLSPSPVANRMTMSLPEGESTNIPANTWTPISGIGEVPEGYDQLVVGVYVQPSFEGAVRFSDLSVQQATGNVLIAEGAITADKIATGTITADSGVIGSLDAGKITAGQMDAVHIKAGSITADRLVVGQGENLIVDPHFSAPSSDPSVPNLTDARIETALQAGMTWVSPNRLGWDKTTASTSQHALRLGNKVSDVSEAVVPVIGGRRYHVSWQVFSDVASTTVGTRAAVLWLKEDGTTTYVSGNPGSYTMIGSAGVNPEVTSELLAPIDATHMRVDLQTNGHHGQGRLDFMRPVVRLMTDGTVITQDAVATKHIMADSITGAKIDTSSVISRLVEADLFVGRTFTGGTVDGALFQTHSAANTGTKMSPTLGLQVYGADNTPVLSLPPSGEAFFKGSIEITSGTIPQDKITDLPDKMTTLDTTYQIVDGWASSDDVTLIDGGKIATHTIAAEAINLGNTANLIPGGNGDIQEDWPGFELQVPPPGTPSDVVAAFALLQNGVGNSPRFTIGGTTKFDFSYEYSIDYAGVDHATSLLFYDINGTLTHSIDFDPRVGADPNYIYTASHPGIVVPENAVYASITVYANSTRETGLATNGLYVVFTGFKAKGGAQTMLTGSGLTSYKDGVQTLRLNGEDNLLIGEVLTGRPGVEPYIKLSSRSTVGAIDFYSVESAQTNHGALFWQINNDNNTGRFRFYAIDDPPIISGNRTYAAGLEFVSNGLAEYHGKLSQNSETFKVGVETWDAPGFGAAGTASSFGSYTKTFPVPYPSGVIPRVFLTMEASAGAEMTATLKSVSNTSFTYLVVNLAPRSSEVTRLHWLAVCGTG